ncbi:MAG: RNA degradosome polyphosphate kinase, partial [Phycisphaeraceae bacterium]|nr:RNA degradosome polyphosphate kinase [Phycisphaeraceae bacterium]
MNDRATSGVETPRVGAGLPRAEKLYLNRDLTWLQFNRRVLHEAVDERTPLLDRVACLAIFSSNLDEFYQKRVGTLKRQIAAGLNNRTPDGLTPQEQLAAIRAQIVDLQKLQNECYRQSIRPALAKHQIHLLSWAEMTDAERDFAISYFHANLFPVLTPLSVDPGHPFPFISNLSLSLGVLLRHPDRPVRGQADVTPFQFARVKVP